MTSFGIDLMVTSVSTADLTKVKETLSELIYISVKEDILNGVHLYAVINAEKLGFQSEELENCILGDLTNNNMDFLEDIHNPTLKTCQAYSEKIESAILLPNLDQFKANKKRITNYLKAYFTPVLDIFSA